MTAGRLDAMKKAIVGLVMTVEEVEGSFKLNQHKSEADYAAIAGALAAQADDGCAADRAFDERGAAAVDYNSPSDNEPRSKGACHDPHRQPQPKTSRRRWHRRSPPSSSTARPERRASAFRSAFGQQSDVVVKSIAEDKRKDAAAKRALMERGRSRHPLPAGRCGEGNRCADRRHGRRGAQGARRVDGFSRRAATGPTAFRNSRRIRPTRSGRHGKSPIRAAIRPARSRCCGRWSMPACCLRTIPSPSTRSAAIRAAASR